MKNLFLSMLAVAGMLMATSCSKEDAVSESSDFVNATFTIGAENGIGTRADIGKGLSANTVACAVFDANGEEMAALRQYVPVNDKQATYSVRLAKGQNYRVAFFAYNADSNGNSSYYDVTDMKSIKILGSQASNIEARDAFTKYINIAAADLTNKSNIEETVTLKRPFAQLNLGVDDDELADAEKAGVVITNSAITVSNVWNAFNAYDDDIADDATSATMEFAMNAKPTESLKIGTDEYTYLALNYLLVGDKGQEKSLTDVEFKWETANGKTNEPTTHFLNIPVQRNYRTNIIGKLLTTPAEFDIIIDADFSDDHNNDGTNEPNIDYNVVFNVTDLQALIDAAPIGKTTAIYLGADITGDVIEYQKADRHIIINGRYSTDGGTSFVNHKYDGTIKIHRGSSSDIHNGSITIKNINFETSTPELNFVMPNDFGVENGVTRRYSNNVIVENCTFTANGAAVNTAVGVQAKSCNNLQVLNCTANNMHSLLQAQSCGDEVIVKNATINGKNGIAFKQVKNAVVENTTIAAAAYGIRFDGNTDNYGITIKDNNITASQPFIVRKMTGKNNAIALEGNNTLTVSTSSIATETPAYQIVITNDSDDKPYSKPTGTYTLTGADNYLVYPRDYVHPVASWDEFTAALAANEPKIKLTDNIEYSGNYSLKKDVVIDLNGKSITMPLFYVFSTATIMNGTINGKMYARTGCKATLEGLTFSGTISDDLSTEGHLQVQGGCDVYAKSCTFAATTVNGSHTRSLSIEASSSGTRKFEDCDFKFVSWGNGAGKYKKNVYINTMNGTTTVDFKNCKLNGKAPNILFAGTYSLTNLTMSGCDNTAPTLEINRAKDTVTEADWAHISSLIANNKFTQVRVFYAGGSSEYIQ